MDRVLDIEMAFSQLSTTWNFDICAISWPRQKN